MNNDLDNTDIDLSSVNLSRPLLDSQQRKCITGDVKVINDERWGRRLSIPLVLDEEAVDTNNNPVYPGFVVFTEIGLTPKGAYTQDFINNQLARFYCAVTGEDKAGIFKMSDLGWASDKTLLATFGVQLSGNGKTYQRVTRFNAVK